MSSHRTFLAVALLCSGAACADAEPVGPGRGNETALPTPGAYALVSVAGRDLPYFTSSGTTGSTSVMADTLVLGADSALTHIRRIRYIYRTSAERNGDTTYTVVRSGRYRRGMLGERSVELRGSYLTVNADDTPSPVAGQATATGITVLAYSRTERSASSEWVYRKVGATN